ncbi:MAG: glucokinase [Deltaproteobacteria bacterium]|nr:glucokinase [Deltaproteobacteria bacterium]
MTILAGDIGGTKVRLGLFETQGPTPSLVREAVFDSASWDSLDALCVQFLSDSRVTSACFGLPGVVSDQRCETTHLRWVIDGRALAHTLGVAPSRVLLLNDLQATAYGVLAVDPSQCVCLQEGTADRNANIAVIAAGTGLGESALIAHQGQHFAIATEGGHKSFAPRTDEDVALLRFTQARLGGENPHVSVERIVSGPGLAWVYASMAQREPGAESPRVRERMAHEDPSAVIGDEAVQGRDVLCMRAARRFCELYGAEAGNLALSVLSRGGVYVAGGVSAKLAKVLELGDFCRGFSDKGRFAQTLAAMPIWLITDERLPLWGAARASALLA